MHHIGNNFGSFKIPGNSHEISAAKLPQEKSAGETKDVLRYVITEIQIGTVDSIERAAAMLAVKKIAIPSFQSLQEFYQKTANTVRDAKFTESSKQLQEKVITEINKLLA